MSHPNTNTNEQTPAELRCNYRSMVCRNPRARKRNGELHQLCQEHRVKANETQRRAQERMREQRRQQQQQNQSSQQSFSPTRHPRLVAFLTQDIVELDADDDVDKWEPLDPLDGPAELRPEDLEAILGL